MITTDGERSLKRKWFAEKLLRTISDIDVPAKAVTWDGFKFRVWRYGDDSLKGGRITAPMGAVVVCTSPERDIYEVEGVDYGGWGKCEIAVSENWIGTFTYLTNPYLIYKDVNGYSDVLVASLNREDESTVIAAGYEAIPYKFNYLQSPFGLVDSNEVGSDTIYEQDASPQVGILPYESAEAFWLSHTVDTFVDFNSNDLHDFPKYIIDTTFTPLGNNNSGLSNRQTVTLQEGGRENENYSARAQRVMQFPDKDTCISHQIYFSEWVSGSLVRARNLSPPYHSNIMMDDALVNNGLPYGYVSDYGETWYLSTIFCYDPSQNSLFNVGSYVYKHEGALVHISGHDATATIKAVGIGTWAQEFFDYFPSEEKWNLFYIWSEDDAHGWVTSAQFLPLFDYLATDDMYTTGGNVIWKNALRMFYQVFPYPNNNWITPHDSVMFHGSDGLCYTWTRKYGGMRITPDGIFSCSPSAIDAYAKDSSGNRNDMYVPAVVDSTDGVRPEITYAGTFNGHPTYLCVANYVGEAVQSVYLGTPFIEDVTTPETPFPTLDDMWVVLPGTQDGDTLVHVRPVTVTDTSVFLLGVVKYGIPRVDSEGNPVIDPETEEQIIDYYYAFASLQWTKPDEGTETPDIHWNRMATLPFGVTDFDTFQVCLYGNDPRVKAMAEYPSLPPALPTMPVCTQYSKYAIGLP